MIPVRFLVITVVLSACGSERTVQTDWVQREDSSGIRLVRNGTAAAWGDGTGTVREVLRLGRRDDGPSHLLFGEIRDIAVGADGRIYVANGQSTTIRVFESDGRFVSELGGPGGGPGELDSVERVWITGDTLIVIGGLRATLFIDGTPGSTLRLSRPGVVRMMPAGPGPDGWRVLIAQTSRPDPAVQNVWRTTLSYRRYDPRLDSVGDVAFELSGSEYRSVEGRFVETLFIAADPARPTLRRARKHLSGRPRGLCDSRVRPRGP